MVSILHNSRAFPRTLLHSVLQGKFSAQVAKGSDNLLVGIIHRSPSQQSSIRAASV